MIDEAVVTSMIDEAVMIAEPPSAERERERTASGRETCTAEGKTRKTRKTAKGAVIAREAKRYQKAVTCDSSFTARANSVLYHATEKAFRLRSLAAFSPFGKQFIPLINYHSFIRLNAE
jgi:hypothetical protein